MTYNISNFTNTSDYLPILNGVINTDLLVIFLLAIGAFKSKSLSQWYSKFGLGAVIADVLVIFIVIIIARFLYPFIFSQFSLWKFTGLAIFIQIIHDILFNQLVTITPRGFSKIIDTFKDYAKEHGIRIIVADSCMMISACLLSSYFATMSLNANIITLITTMYFLPYVLYH